MTSDSATTPIKSNSKLLEDGGHAWAALNLKKKRFLQKIFIPNKLKYMIA